MARSARASEIAIFDYTRCPGIFFDGVHLSMVKE